MEVSTTQGSWHGPVSVRPLFSTRPATFLGPRTPPGPSLLGLVKVPTRPDRSAGETPGVSGDLSRFRCCAVSFKVKRAKSTKVGISLTAAPETSTRQLGVPTSDGVGTGTTRPLLLLSSPDPFRDPIPSSSSLRRWTGTWWCSSSSRSNKPVVQSRDFRRHRPVRGLT